jgi:UDP:flavonoid glycosyltransferase YjiC (YdhE family)
MRIALGTNPALGHVLPLMPLALAAREAGHTITAIGGASIGPTLAAYGIRHVVAGPPDLAAMFDAMGTDRLEGPRLAAAVWSRGFAELVARPMAHALLELAETWRPDLVLHEDSEQGTWIAAERLGIPHLAVQATAWRGAMARLSAEPAGRLRAELDLPADPGLDDWHRHGFLATRPASLRDPADPLPATASDLRPVATDDPTNTSAPWLDEPPEGRARVAVTLGTVAPERRAALLGVILEALAPLDAEIVVALGPGLEPRAFLPRPANVRVVSFVPMARLMPACDLVVCHGGSGTVLAALAAGRPLVILPMAADQPQNAAACRNAGAAVVIDRDARTPHAIRGIVADALDNRDLARAAERVRREIAVMPPPEAVVRRLEHVAGRA